MKIILMITIALMARAASAMSLNDVSVLLPLPTEQTFALLLSPNEQGTRGILVPEDLYSRFENLNLSFSNQLLYLQGLKVIGVRLDPCFTEGYGPQACRHQIRLVWQPVVEGNHGFTTLDTAMHSFYEFKDETEWQAILAQWPRTSAADSAVQINPQILAESLTGKFWQTLHALILAHCGEQTLVRVTTMQSNMNTWVFRGFDLQNGKTSPTAIARIQAKSQQLFDAGFPRVEFEGNIDPLPTSERAAINDWNSFVSDSQAHSSGIDMKAVMDQALDIENPQRENPGTIDCVSCHVAQNVRHWGEARLGDQFDWSFASRYQSSLNLKNTTSLYGTNRVRAFGYFGQDPVISQRLINETAAVVTSLGR